MIWDSQQGFTKDRSYLINLITFCRMMALMGKGRATDIVYLNFNKVFCMLLYYIFNFKLE